MTSLHMHRASFNPAGIYQALDDIYIDNGLIQVFHPWGYFEFLHTCYLSHTNILHFRSVLKILSGIKTAWTVLLLGCNPTVTTIIWNSFLKTLQSLRSFLYIFFSCLNRLVNVSGKVFFFIYRIFIPLRTNAFKLCYRAASLVRKGSLLSYA